MKKVNSIQGGAVKFLCDDGRAAWLTFKGDKNSSISLSKSISDSGLGVEITINVKEFQIEIETEEKND